MNTTNQLFYESFKELSDDDIVVLATFFGLIPTIEPEIARVLMSIIQSEHVHDSNMSLFLPVYGEDRKLEIDISTKRCFQGRGYTALEEKAIGQYSTIYHGKKYDKRGKLSKDVTFKIILLTDKQSGIHSQQHFDTLKQKLELMNQYGIGPKLISSWICLPRSSKSTHGGIKIGIIVMEKWDGDLATISRDALGSISKQVLDDLYAQLVTLHQLGFVHGDSTLSNILFKRDNNSITKLTFTDFDFSGQETVPKQQIENVLADNAVSTFLTKNNVPVSSSLPVSLIDFATLGYLYRLNKYDLPESLTLMMTPHEKKNLTHGYEKLDPSKKKRRQPCPKKQCTIM